MTKEQLETITKEDLLSRMTIIDEHYEGNDPYERPENPIYYFCRVFIDTEKKNEVDHFYIRQNDVKDIQDMDAVQNYAAELAKEDLEEIFEDRLSDLKEELEEYLNGLVFCGDIYRSESEDVLEDFDSWAKTAQHGDCYYYDGISYELKLYPEPVKEEEDYEV